MKTVFFVRHGESEANRDQLVPPRETPLSDHGREQASKVAERLQNLDIETVVASEYPRAQETALPTCEVLNLPLEVSDCFNEMWEPSTYVGSPDQGSAVLEYRRKRRERIGSDPNWKEEDGDSFADLFTRFTAAEAFLKSHASTSLVVFSHAYFLMGFLCKLLLDAEHPSQQWLAMVSRIKKSNCGITMLELSDDAQWKVVTLNDHAHFAE